MNIKFTLKNIVAAISAAIILLIVVLMIILSVTSRKPVAAFYGISQRNQQKITDVLQTTHQRKNKKSLPYEIVVLDDSMSLERALKKSKKPDLLFIENGKNEEFAEAFCARKHLSFSGSILNGMSTSVIQSVNVKNGKVNAVPLLIDHYELDVNLEKFHSSSVKNINVLGDVEKLAKMTKSSTPSPIVFPGAEADGLINFFGALTEAVSGHQAVESATAKLNRQIASGKVSQNDFYETLSEMTKEGEFSGAYTTLKNWSELGIIPKNVYSMNIKDIKAFMSANLSTAAFITLSDHREIERDVISKFSSVYYPSATNNNDRRFTAPIIFAVSMSKDKVARNSIEKMANELQGTLSSATGLGPVQKNCGVPDVQADDVRYWVAASNKPLPALSDALFVSKQQKNNFAEALRSILR